jgi:hypothetical protein
VPLVRAALGLDAGHGQGAQARSTRLELGQNTVQFRSAPAKSRAVSIVQLAKADQRGDLVAIGRYPFDF